MEDHSRDGSLGDVGPRGDDSERVAGCAYCLFQFGDQGDISGRWAILGRVVSVYVDDCGHRVSFQQTILRVLGASMMTVGYPARVRGKCPDYSTYEDGRKAANAVRPDFSEQPLR